MKKLLTFLFLISLSWQVCAQKTGFIRVYDTNGKKVKKGHVLALTDTSLQLKVRGADTANLTLASIGKIKTRRSWGHRFLIGSLMGTGIVAISGATNINPYTLALPCAAIGLLIEPPRSKTFIINGDLNKWNSFQAHLSETGKRNK